MPPERTTQSSYHHVSWPQLLHWSWSTHRLQDGRTRLCDSRIWPSWIWAFSRQSRKGDIFIATLGWFSAVCGADSRRVSATAYVLHGPVNGRYDQLLFDSAISLILRGRSFDGSCVDEPSWGLCGWPGLSAEKSIAWKYASHQTNLRNGQ